MFSTTCTKVARVLGLTKKTMSDMTWTYHSLELTQEKNGYGFEVGCLENSSLVIKKISSEMAANHDLRVGDSIMMIDNTLCPGDANNFCNVILKAGEKIKLVVRRAVPQDHSLIVSEAEHKEGLNTLLEHNVQATLVTAPVSDQNPGTLSLAANNRQPNSTCHEINDDCGPIRGSVTLASELVPPVRPLLPRPRNPVSQISSANTSQGVTSEEAGIEPTNDISINQFFDDCFSTWRQGRLKRKSSFDSTDGPSRRKQSRSNEYLDSDDELDTIYSDDDSDRDYSDYSDMDEPWVVPCQGKNVHAQPCKKDCSARVGFCANHVKDEKRNKKVKKQKKERRRRRQ